MKPIETWTPEETVEAERYLQKNPYDLEVKMALSARQELEAKRVKLYRDDKVKPDHPAAALSVRTWLPARLGGLTIGHFEPSVEEFRAANTGKYAPDSPEEKAALQDFRDEAWAKRYDEAKLQGVPAVRRGITRAEDIRLNNRAVAIPTAEEIPDEKARAAELGHRQLARAKESAREGEGKLMALVDGLIWPGTSAAVSGLVGKASPAAGKYLDQARADVDPASQFVAETGGALAPGSLMSKAGSLLLGRMGPAEGILGGMGKGAVTGGALSIGGNTGGNIGRAIESGLRDSENKGALERIRETGVKSLLEAPSAALTGATIGAPLGAIGHGFPGHLRNEATAEGRTVRAAEDAGAQTSFLEPGGWKAPPTLQVRGLPPNVHPTDNAISLARPMVAKGAAKAVNEVLAPIEADNGGYFAVVDQAGAKGSFSPMTKALVNTIKSRSFESTEGGALPMLDNKELVKQLHKTAEVKLLPLHEARDMERAGAIAVPLDVAESTGMVEKGFGSAPAGPRPPGATMPPGPDDAAAEAFLARAREIGLDQARAENIGPHVAGRPSVPAPGPDMGGQGLDVGSDRATIIPPGPITPRQFRMPPPVGTPDPSAYMVVFVPKEGTAQQVHQVIQAVDDAAGIAKDTRGGRPDPAFKDLPAAARATRDQFPSVPGITDKYPDVTIAGADGQPLKLTGWSAMAHAHSQKLAELKLQTKRAGLSSDRFDPTDVLEQEKAGQALYGVGPGVGETDRTAAILDMARREPGGERAVKDVIASRILRGGALSPKSHQPMHGSAADPSLAASAWQRFQYHLDPVAKALGQGLPAAGTLGPKAIDPVTQALLDLAARTQQEHRVTP